MSNQRLRGWKAIAAHLGTTVRSAQRWAAASALPVSRLSSKPGAGVYAVAAELDAWRMALVNAPVPGNTRSSADISVTSAAPAESTVEVEQAGSGRSSIPVPSPPRAPLAPMVPKPRWRVLIPAALRAAVVAFAALGAAGPARAPAVTWAGSPLARSALLEAVTAARTTASMQPQVILSLSDSAGVRCIAVTPNAETGSFACSDSGLISFTPRLQNGSIELAVSSPGTGGLPAGALASTSAGRFVLLKGTPTSLHSMGWNLSVTWIGEIDAASASAGRPD